jgi:hypothetical protein
MQSVQLSENIRNEKWIGIIYLVLVNLRKPRPTMTVLAYYISNGHYGETSLDSLNALGLGAFEGNIWAGNGTTKVSAVLFKYQ